jgi:hypothetical protein
MWFYAPAAVEWALAALIVALGAVVVWVFQPAIVARRQLLGAPDECEASFTDPATQQLHPFPSIERDPPSLTLTVVVPAYNEEERLHLMLDPALAFFGRKRQQVGWWGGRVRRRLVAASGVVSCHAMVSHLSRRSLPLRDARTRDFRLRSWWWTTAAATLPRQWP